MKIVPTGTSLTQKTRMRKAWWYMCSRLDKYPHVTDRQNSDINTERQYSHDKKGNLPTTADGVFKVGVLNGSAFHAGYSVRTICL